jgi:hypothetical protein
VWEGQGYKRTPLGSISDHFPPPSGGQALRNISDSPQATGHPTVVSMHGQKRRSDGSNPELPREIKLTLNGLPLTHPHHLERLVNHVRVRPVRPYWTPSRGRLFDALPKPSSDGLVYQPCGQRTWFRSTRYPPASSRNINILARLQCEDGAAAHVASRNAEKAKNHSRATARKAGQKLSGEFKLSKEQRTTMSPEELWAHKVRLWSRICRFCPLVYAANVSPTPTPAGDSQGRESPDGAGSP